MNPNGLVPTLDEDGFILWESNAILRYLCAAHAPETAFWPAEPRARATIDHWMDWQQTTLSRSMTIIFQGLVRTPPEKRNPEAIEAAIKDCSRIWGILDAELARRTYVGGTIFTLADIPLGVHVHRWFTMEFSRPSLPRLEAWYNRLCERPPYRTHVALPLA